MWWWNGHGVDDEGWPVAEVAKCHGFIGESSEESVRKAAGNR
jgi:hypothetical protein